MLDNIIKYGKYVLLVAVVAFYIFMNFEMPACSAKYDLTPPEAPKDSNGLVGYPIVQHYYLGNDVLKGFQAEGILNYGRNNPMLSISGLDEPKLVVELSETETTTDSPPVTDEHDESTNEDDNNDQGGFKHGVVDDIEMLVPVPFDRQIAELLFHEGVLPVDKNYFGVSSGFGVRQNPFSADDPVGAVHIGIDISKGLDGEGRSIIDGQPVYAVFEGTVYMVNFEHQSGKGYGNLVVIQHDSFVTYYAHLKDIEIGVTSGRHVETGQQIGSVGSTGNSTGPHLHFELRIDGMPTDPFPYLFEMLKRED